MPMDLVFVLKWVKSVIGFVLGFTLKHASRDLRSKYSMFGKKKT